MFDEHPNISVLKRFNPADIAASLEVFSKDVVFHYFNSALPDMQGDYKGRDGLLSFFAKLAEKTDASFSVNPISATPIGDEFVVSHVKNTMTFPDREIEVDAVVVWRIVEGLIKEAWDIPAIHTAKTKSI